MKMPMNWAERVRRHSEMHSPGILPNRMTMSGSKVET